MSVPAFPATAPKLSGSIAGIVRDSAGIPQMGATVLLFNKYEKLLQRALTNERGSFGFDSLIPDVYAVRVSLASFMPAMKQKIAVQPGMQSLLYINLATLLSSIELVYAPPGQGSLMSDDWKWTLKSATATRAVLRFDSKDIVLTGPPVDPQHSSSSAIFSGTRAIVQVSGGDAGSLMTYEDQQDLGTAFALATSVFGRNQLRVSGNVGYSLGSGLPAAGFRTTYSREGMSPEVSVTMRQIYLPGRNGMLAITGQQDGLPALRSISLGMMDKTQIAPNVQLEYGLSLDTVSFFDRLNYFSPFARLTYDMGRAGFIQFAYSSGAPPTALASRYSATASEVGPDAAGLTESLAALALLPRVSMRDGLAKVQRTQDLELGYEKKFANRTVNVSVYREIVANGALTMEAPDGLFAAGDVLPDLASNSNIVNIGSYQRYGYAASLTQSLGDHLEIGASAGRTGVFMASANELQAATSDDVRSNLRTGQRFWGSLRASTKLPVTATEITTTYQFTDYSALMPTHYYLTQKTYPEPGLNIHVGQPIPVFGGMAGHLEATIDLHNILAQGYLPLFLGERRLLLMQNPRMLRGGLSFIF